MKIFKFVTFFAPAIFAENTNDVNVARLAESLDHIKFELNEILLSRENERDHLEVRNLTFSGSKFVQYFPE